ncbi:hypothetical protein E2562_005860 [Oryza meyeriana var. granulata]|uniref:RING-type domain-containing protein n=1 Tax=Oryza meyeriana var. granulata TaxID=110450 RepID=A0A6G1DUP4_9ORYZ|nr:hypothetical protein E2562_005860 [Oryza meyeriana var. granulata]
MAQLDADGGRAAPAAHSHAIVDDHRHVIDMGRLDMNSRSAAAHVDDGDSGSAGSDDVPSCVVCTEPLEWVAIGPCGHRVVCSACAARVRSIPNPDHRCCVCRTICPTVVVTKVAAAEREIAFSTLPAASEDGRAGEYWYCAAMSAYFDDEQQYEATKEAVSRRRAQYIAQFWLRVFFASLLGVLIGSIFAIGSNFAIGSPDWVSSVGIVSGFTVFSVGLTIIFYFKN